MSYPKHVSKQGPDRFTPGRGDKGGGSVRDLLAGSKKDTTFVRDNKNVPAASKPGGSEIRRGGEGHPNRISQATEPSARPAGKSRRVTP